jgi:hypothetical protein
MRENLCANWSSGGVMAPGRNTVRMKKWRVSGSAEVRGFGDEGVVIGEKSGYRRDHTGPIRAGDRENIEPLFVTHASPDLNWDQPR